MDVFFIFIAIGLITCMILLYGRKKAWATDRNRWIITSVLLAAATIGFLINGKAAIDQGFQCLVSPIIYNSFDRLFKKLSEKLSGRDFYLYLRYSDEINDTMLGTNPHVNGWDKFFSIVLLLIIVGLLFGAVLLFRGVKLGYL